MKSKIKGISYLLLGCFALSGPLFAADSWDGTTTSTTTTTTRHHGHKHHDKRHHERKHDRERHVAHHKGRAHYKDEMRYKDAVFVTEKSPGYFEILGGPGASQLGASNFNSLGVTSSETDTLQQTNGNAWDTYAGQLGFGYVHFFGNAQQYSDNVQWFPSIEPELNSYYLSSNSIKGNVLRFGNPTWNDLTFDIPIRSARLMLDTALTVASWKKLSVYAIGGIGAAWNRVGYKDTANANDPCTEAGLSLNARSNWDFAWEAGAGLTYAFNNRVGLSLEYLYAGLGKVKTGSSGSTGTIPTPMLVPAKFNLTSSAGLLLLHIAL